jgi:hypothetical protein
MEEMTTLNLGLDPGFGYFKVACAELRAVGTQSPQVAVVPSVVGVGQTDLGLLSVGNLGRRRSRQPDQVSFDVGGVRTYLVGENVARFARPVERVDFLRLSDGPEPRALFYDVLFRLFGPSRCDTPININLMAGLPVEVMADRERAGAALRGLRRWMVGEHVYTVNDHQVRLGITSVQVMAQPAGTFFAWGLNDQGKWMRGREGLKAPVAIPLDVCPACMGSGHLEYDSLHVLAADVPAEDIRWCTCPLGAEKRQDYEGYRAELLQRKLARLFEQAGIPGRFCDLTLDSLPPAHREGKRRAIAAARMFVAEGAVVPARLGEYDPAAALRDGESIRCPALPRRSLVLSGPLGVGKTGLLTPVLRHSLEQGQPALWIEFYDFCLEVQSGYKDGSANNKLVAARQAPLILLDDVGEVERREAETDDKRRILWSVLNGRHGDDLPTLVTTNLDERSFRRQFGGRVSDRLWEMAFVVPVGGVNLRTVEV